MKKLTALLALVLALALCVVAPVTVGAESEFVKPEETVTLKYVARGDIPSPSNFETVWSMINEKLLADLNVQVEVEYVGSTDVGSKLMLKCAGNEPFDFIFMHGSSAEYKNAAASNAFRAYTMDEVQAYMPQLYSELPSIGWEQAKVNGDMYIIPNCNVEWNEQFFIIRDDLREKYGLEPVSTLDDLIAYWTAVTENESGMEAVAPYNMSSSLVVRPQEWKSLNYGAMFSLTDENYTVFNAYDTQEMLDFYKLMNEFYTKGFWAADAIANKTDPRDRFNTGLAASSARGNTGVNQMAQKMSTEHPDWKPLILNITPDKKCVQGSLIGNGTCLSRNTENAELSMRAIDLLAADQDYVMLLQYGIKDVNWSLTEDGKRIANNDLPDDEKFVQAQHWNFFNTEIQFPAGDDYEGFAEITANLADNAIYCPVMAFSFDNSVVETECANVTATISEYEPALTYGMVDDVEGYVEEFRAALKASGIDTIIEAYQTQLDAFLGK